MFISLFRLVPLPVFLRVDKEGEGALSMPDAEVIGAGTREEAVMVDGSVRPSESSRMRGAEQERGTGSWSDQGRADVAGTCRIPALCAARGLGE